MQFVDVTRKSKRYTVMAGLWWHVGFVKGGWTLGCHKFSDPGRVFGLLEYVYVARKASAASESVSSWQHSDLGNRFTSIGQYTCPWPCFFCRHISDFRPSIETVIYDVPKHHLPLDLSCCACVKDSGRQERFPWAKSFQASRFIQHLLLHWLVQGLRNDNQ